MSRVRKLSIRLSSEAYELLQKGAAEAKLDEESFAKVCIYSVLANYAEEVGDDAAGGDSVLIESDVVGNEVRG